MHSPRIETFVQKSTYLIYIRRVGFAFVIVLYKSQLYIRRTGFAFFIVSILRFLKPIRSFIDPTIAEFSSTVACNFFCQIPPHRLELKLLYLLKLLPGSPLSE